MDRWKRRCHSIIGARLVSVPATPPRQAEVRRNRRRAYALIAIVMGVVMIGAVARSDAATRLLTGAGIRDESLTGADIKNASVASIDLKNGGVGSTDIGASAVTAAKLALAAVTTEKLEAGAVTADKLAAGAVGTGSLADGSVTAAKLAAGAVPTYTAGNGLAMTGTQLRATGDPDPKLLQVATTGAEFSSVQTAIDSISDESASNQYVVRIGPGVFSERVTVPANIHLVGAGKATVIRSAGAATASASATLTLEAGATARTLLVDNTGGSAFSVGVRVSSGVVYVDDLDVTAASAATATYGVLLDGSPILVATDSRVVSSGNSSPLNAGIRLESAGVNGGHLYLNRSESAANGGTLARGIDIEDGSAGISWSSVRGGSGTNSEALRAAINTGATVSWSELTGQNGTASSVAMQLEGGYVTVRHSDLSAQGDSDTYGVRLALGGELLQISASTVDSRDVWLRAAAAGTVRVGASWLRGGVSGPGVAGTTFNCPIGGNYNEAFVELNANCQ
jgi:hypothetical protein